MVLAELILGLIFGILFTIIYEFLLKIIPSLPIVKLNGFHFHHSIYGVIFIVVYFFVKIPLLLGIGLGIILWHSWNEKKFVFINKT